MKPFNTAYYNSKTFTFSAYYKGEITDEFLNVDEVYISGYCTHEFPITVVGIHNDTKFIFGAHPAQAELHVVDNKRVLFVELSDEVCLDD